MDTHVLFPVDDLKGSVSHTDQRLICTDLKKVQEKCTEQSKICTRLSFLNPPVGIEAWVIDFNVFNIEKIDYCG